VERILDPLFARALMMENPARAGGRRACLLSLDLCTAGDEAADGIRNLVSRRFGFEREAIMLHLLQNHSAPSLGGHLLLEEDCPHLTPELWWTWRGDPDYYEWLLPRISQAVEQALERLEPVTMACGGLADGRMAFNRRFVMRDGWVQTQPRDLSAVLHPEGPADPEVGIACFKNRSGEIVAAMLHHTAHPVSHFGKRWVTASWPGQWAAQMKSVLGETCVPVVVNGCCGNVNRVNALAPSQQISDEQVGQWLTETAREVMDEMQWQDEALVRFASQTVQVPHGRMAEVVGADAVERAHALLRDEPHPQWCDDEHTQVDIDWLFAVVIVDLCRRLEDATYTYEVQAFRVGELAIVGLTGEPFVEGQLRIKLESPARRTFVAHMCNGWVGYIPTVHAYRARNYNFRTANGEPVRRGTNLFLLAPDALADIADQARQTLEVLFSGGRHHGVPETGAGNMEDGESRS